MITLKEFMSETLKQISEAAIEFASSDEGFEGASVNPPMQLLRDEHRIKSGFLLDARNNIVVPVDFDVAITTEESEKAGAKGGIRVLSLASLEGGVDAKNATGTVSRVKFTLPLSLPSKARV